MPKPRSREGPVNVIPDYIAQSKLLRRNKVTKKSLPSYTEAMMLLHAPEAQRLFWKALLEGLDSRDKEFVRMAGEIFELLKKGPGISITQQILQQNLSGNNGTAMGFDAFVRQLAEARSGHPLPPPAGAIDVRPADTAAPHPIPESEPEAEAEAEAEAIGED
jgi:hypothetical protein